MNAFAPFAPAATPEQLARLDLNDYGNGLRLILLAGGRIDDDGEVDSSASRLLYLLGSGWIGFNGRHWDRKFGEDLARRMAHQVAQKVRGLYDPHFKDKMAGPAFFKWADGCGSAGSTSAMLRQAQSYLTVEIDAFDADPMVINCRNGTVKLKVAGGRLMRVLAKHSPADRLMRMADVEFDPKAKAPLFERTAADSLPIEAERIYFQRVLGYASTGFTHEQAFFIVQGPGQDGKSTLLDAAREALGGYAETGSVLTFLDAGLRGGGDHNTDLVKLSGDVRMVVLSEPPRGARLNEGLLKAWTSGAPITVRELREKPFNFRPAGKLIWECNAFPVAKGDDEGIWRRLRPLLFRHKVPNAKLDKLLPQKLRLEQAGILNWLLDGVEDWLCGADGAGGLREPDSVRKVLEDYRKASSPFGDWLQERCVWGEGAANERTLSKALYDDYKEWAEAQGIEKPMSTTSFGNALRDRQVLLAGKDGRGNKYRGPIRLKTLAELTADSAASDRAYEGVSSAGGQSLGEPPEPGAHDGADEWEG